MDSSLSLETADTWFRQGMQAYYNNNDDQRALECFREALNLNPSHFQTYAEQGNILRYIGKYEEALIELDKSIAIQKNAAAYFIKARVLAEQKKLEEAKLCFELGKSMTAEDV